MPQAFSSLLRWLNALGVRTRRLNPTERLGHLGERRAARSLRKLGYRVLGRNLHVPMGEADILCLAPDEQTIVLVEVKSRIVSPDQSDLQRPTEAAVDRDKRQKLSTILTHLSRHNRWHNRPKRIDVVAVDFDSLERVVDLRHHVDAVR